MFCKFIDGQVVDGSICMEPPFTTTTQIIDGNEYESKIYDPDYFPIEIPPQPVGSDRLSYAFVDGKIVCEWLAPVDPLDLPASSAEIKEKHRELEQSPIIVFGNLIDCDERSELRMRDALVTWDYRPVQPGMFEDLNGVRVIYWTLGNNAVIPINKAQLQSFFDEMILQRAIRGANLYRRYREIKSSGCTLRELNDLSTWE